MKKTLAFSLVELSIVLVIIGLIVASVTIGQNLVRQSKLKNLISETDKFKYSNKIFITKYDSSPGDMPNAFNYWGTACSTDAADCNGDGNGLIIFESNDADDNESYRAWQHLYLAGILPHYVTGVGEGVNGNSANIGVNVPASRLKNIGFMYISDIASHPTPFLMIGNERVGFENLKGASLSPLDGYYIDSKMDDAIPGTGILQAEDGTGTATDCIASAAYNVTLTVPGCMFYFYMD